MRDEKFNFIPQISNNCTNSSSAIYSLLQDQVDSYCSCSAVRVIGVSSDESPEQCLNMSMCSISGSASLHWTALGRRRLQSKDADCMSAVAVVIISLLAPRLKYQK